MSRRWFAGSTVNTLIRVITSLFAEIVVIVSLPSERVEIRPELRCCRAPARGWKGSAGTTAAANGIAFAPNELSTMGPPINPPSAFVILEADMLAVAAGSGAAFAVFHE
jgi:hypothetical protein